MSQRRLIETTILGLIGVLLAVATVNDVVRQTHTSQRLTADLNTWRTYTGHAYHNLAIEQDLKGTGSTREVVCGNTSPGGPKTHTQLCLIMRGPVVQGRRAVYGGYYLPPHLLDDVRSARYACFGEAKSGGLCPKSAAAYATGAS
jgi:hypothetical protein